MKTPHPPPLYLYDQTDSAAYYEERASKCAGAFYGGDGSAVAANVVFILAVIAWVAVTCSVLFVALKLTVGMRVTKEMEVGWAGIRLGWDWGRIRLG